MDSTFQCASQNTVEDLPVTKKQKLENPEGIINDESSIMAQPEENSIASSIYSLQVNYYFNST